MPNKKIALIVGTRPEAIKLIPLYFKLKKSAIFTPVMISTGQHREMLSQIFDFFKVQPEIELDLMTHNQSLSSLTSLLFSALDEAYRRIMPDMVCVQGDTTTALVGAMVAFYHKIKISHVEAGLRTNSKYNPFPEETNRVLISELADYNFSPTTTATSNLINASKSNIFTVGNTVVDSLVLGLEIVKQQREFYRTKYQYQLKDARRNILITGHRRESFGKGFEEITNALLFLSKKYVDYNFIYPVHLNPNVKELVYAKLGNQPNFYLLDPVSYGDMLFLMINSKLILTDSGGIQEEAPSLNIPLIVMRDNTERPEGIQAGCGVLTGTKKESIIKHFEKIINDESIYVQMSSVNNPYGDGAASEKIVEQLRLIYNV